MQEAPLAYFITFRTYGTWLHGDERGSVAWRRNGYGDPFLHRDGSVESLSRERMLGPAVVLADEWRSTIDAAIRETVEKCNWELHALNVRTNHVHVVVRGQSKPEQMMVSMKAWSTRRLRDAGLTESTRRIWSRHGSTRYLWNEQQVEDACTYVLHGQDKGAG